MIRQRRFTLAILAAVALCARLSFGQYDPPANYYSSATGAGSTLRTQLNKIIDNFNDPDLGTPASNPEYIQTSISYDALRTALQVSDADPANPAKIYVVYNNGVTINKPTGGSIPGWDNGVTWNREHSWPQDRGVDGTGVPDGSDMHHLFPAKESDNGDRGNLNYGGTFGVSAKGKVDGNTKYYPGDADAGMIARAQFYMDVRYDGADSGTSDLVLQSGNPATGGTTMGDLDRLVEWHFAAPPTTFERNRNQIIFTNYQNNRNPFIDHPEYVWSIFKNQTNQSQLSIAGATLNADGSSTKSVDLGRVFVGGAVPAAQVNTLNKTSNDGTYYSVTTSGLATSTVTGRYNAFAITTGSTTSTRSISVGLNTPTSTAGVKSGAVTVDNLDITASGGAGKGANDGNDVFNVSLNVLDHMTPSFISPSLLTSKTLDFGNVAFGSGAPSLSFDVFDLNGTVGSTANMDFDSFTPSGVFSAFTTTLGASAGSLQIAAGTSQAFAASLNLSSVGTFTAIYTLNFSDENITGAINKSLSLTLTGTVRLAGDFNGDGTVDAGDYVVWQHSVGQTVGAAYAGADGDGNLTIDSADYDVWRAHFGESVPASASSLSGSTAVPEPASASLVLLAALFVCHFARRMR